MKKMTSALIDPGEKAVSGLIVGLITYVIGSINLVTIVFFVFMILDFATGTMADSRNGKPFSKDKAKKGIYEKMAMIIFWFSAVLIEVVLREQGSVIGLAMKHPIITIVASFYILGTELLSNLSNLGEMGFKVPRWFVSIGKKMIDNADKTNFGE